MEWTDFCVACGNLQREHEHALTLLRVFELSSIAAQLQLENPKN